jgi:hypothetical protein
MTPLDLAKERLGIERLAELRAWDWKPGKTCRLPYQPDRNESGSVFEGGRLFHDFTSGETMDAPALLARVEGLSNVEACKLFIELAGVKPGDVPRDDLRPPAPAPTMRDRAESPRAKPELPYLAKPGREDVARIAALRGLSVEGVTLAARRGFLYVATLNGRRCWALADASRWLCQLRPLDGKPFVKQDGGTFKARTCRGSWGAWPLGCVEAARFASVALVEGGGDFLAAWHFIAAEGAGAHCAPVGMLGAGHRIPAAALPHFAGKRVRIFAHIDPPNPRGERPGYEAAAKWELQLAEAGATATTFDLSGLTQNDGSPVADLNDLARISAEDFEADPELSAVMTF